MGEGATLVRVVSIRTDGGTQSRASMDDDVVEDYAEKLGRGVKFPPLEVFYDGEDHWLVDGFHRLAAYQRRGEEIVSAIVHQGTQRDAELYSCGVNETHGKQRSRADRRRAIEKLLRDEEWSKRGDRWIAEKCHVSHSTVGIVRRDLESTGRIDQLTERVGQDGKTRALPQRQPAPEPEAQPAPAPPAPKPPAAPQPRERPVPVAPIPACSPVEPELEPEEGGEDEEDFELFVPQLAARRVDLAIGEAADAWPEDQSRLPLIAVLNTWMRRLQRDEARKEGVSHAD